MLVAIAQRRAPAVAARADLLLGRALLESLRLAARPLVRPAQVCGGGAVAALAADAQRPPAARVAIGRRIVAALEACGVALDAHEVGVLLGLRPVEPVAVVDPLAVVEVEPLLAGDVPGRAVDLQAAVVHREQILLERLEADGEGDGVIDGRAVGARRLDPVGALGEMEASRLHVGAEGAIVEAAEHRRVRRRLHRQLVVGAPPRPVLRRVAASAARLVDPPDRRGRRRRGPQAHAERHGGAECEQAEAQAQGAPGPVAVLHHPIEVLKWCSRCRGAPRSAPCPRDRSRRRGRCRPSSTGRRSWSTTSSTRRGRADRP